jgi:hypothetical protein
MKTAGKGPYGTRRQYSEGSFHTLDAGKMMIAGKRLHALDELLNAKQQQAPVAGRVHRRLVTTLRA